jgi:hypothetical protein
VCGSSPSFKYTICLLCNVRVDLRWRLATHKYVMYILCFICKTYIYLYLWQQGDLTKEQYEAERARILGKKVGDGAAAADDAAGDAGKGGPGGPAGYVPPHLRNRDGSAAGGQGGGQGG